MEKYLSVFLLACIKFMFSPILGWQLNLSYMEIVILCGVGAVVSFSFFYFLSAYFIKLSIVNNAKKQERLQKQGKPIKKKKNFTRVNKSLVGVKKKREGFFVICSLAPLLLSIPLGSIVVSKFYRHRSITFFFSTFCIIFWAFILTFIWKIAG